ncbi:peptidylprolyl isomerase [Helicobacter mustelae]|uniref:Peptidyl-prolyl cis-trans isomerase n=1 Tax=Helicobacter mustelae (strain ATCC 43772 / CCUG 25715 / CIP 103759 / LMG 18044 / NCTC 12198 / R85-136P) TaxID=679897 RepID=D3UH51_HELM1|nr:peptidylprolyl isomerase [Helicobacter mustelae]CBG39823.1 peptidyl-prolyl cis-trans isomerase [Helicobacter mustelae 12198]SQH71333.1 peptidyl-prolyl cis-trans isomerase [Helicobacter mustelae]STP12459.1 peptidyl-prolyl cis-trans isomerase [Helicobacter mustelae]
MYEELKTYNPTKEELQGYQYATIKTNKGEIVVKLFPESAPQAVSNFATLSKEGFYKGLSFHRVIAGFVAQGGCPKGTGTGGPGWRITCELKNNPHKHLKGSLSMAHAGRDTGGSQFFLCFVALPHLDGEHTVFGRIDEKDSQSMAVLDSLKQGDVIEDIHITASK